MAKVKLLNVTEVENTNFLVFSTCHNKVSSGRDSDGIDASIMNRNAVLNVESLVVPDLKVAVPSDGCKVLSTCGFG